MKKTVALLLALLLSVAVLPALGEEQSEYVMYTDPMLGYTLEYPAAWVVADSSSYDEAVKKMAGDAGKSAFLSLVGSQIQAGQMSVFLLPGAASDSITFFFDPSGKGATETDLMNVMAVNAALVEEQFGDVQYMDKGGICEIGGRMYGNMTYIASKPGKGYGRYCILREEEGVWIILLQQQIQEDQEGFTQIDAYVDHLLETFQLPESERPAA